MIIKEIIQRVQSLYSKGVESDDTRLSDRHIYSKIKTVRSKLISQALNKKQLVSQWNYQTIPCIELVKTFKNECPCLPPLGCSILKTKYKLPNPLVGLNSHFIQSVTSLNGDITYSEVGWEQKKYKKAEKYTSNIPDYYIRNEYLYITYKAGPKIISITGLFDDAIEANNYPSYCSTDCKEGCDNCTATYDRDLPIDNKMLDTLIEMCSVELIQYFSQNKEDLTNNSRDSIIEEGK